MLAEQRAWAGEQQQDADWQAWRAAHAAGEVQLSQERAMRQSYAAQVAAQFTSLHSARQPAYATPQQSSPKAPAPVASGRPGYPARAAPTG